MAISRTSMPQTNGSARTFQGCKSEACQRLPQACVWILTVSRKHHHRFSRNSVCSRQTTHSSAKTVPTRLAKSTSLFSCIRYPTSLFICLQWLCLPVQLWMVKTLSCLYPGCYIFSIWEPRPPDTNFSVSICLSFPHSLITPSQGSWNQAMQGHNSSGWLKPTTILPRYK